MSVDPKNIMFNRLDSLISESRIQGNYPPFNHVKVDDETHRLEIAVSGFTKNELKVTTKNGLLTVTGEKAGDDKTEYLHKGISSRKFIRSWKLAPEAKIEKVSLKRGILSIDVFTEIPESLKTKDYEINAKADSDSKEFLQD